MAISGARDVSTLVTRIGFVAAPASETESASRTKRGDARPVPHDAGRPNEP